MGGCYHSPGQQCCENCGMGYETLKKHITAAEVMAREKEMNRRRFNVIDEWLEETTLLVHRKMVEKGDLPGWTLYAKVPLFTIGRSRHD